jgi:transposase
MESTGVYWIPLFQILEERGFMVYLVNAHSLFRRMRARLGTAQAITATAHKLARILFHVLHNKEPYNRAEQQGQRAQSS